MLCVVKKSVPQPVQRLCSASSVQCGIHTRGHEVMARKRIKTSKIGSQRVSPPFGLWFFILKLFLVQRSPALEQLADFSAKSDCRTDRREREARERERQEDVQMAWRKGLTGVGAASVAFSGAAYYYRPDPSGELLESRRTRSPKVRGKRPLFCFGLQTISLSRDTD